MELLTAEVMARSARPFGVIAFLTLLLNKTFEKTGEIIVAKVIEQGGKKIKLLKLKPPDTLDAREAAAENQALTPEQHEDIGEALLVEKIESAAKADPEIKKAVKALASDADTAAQENPQLAAVIGALTQAVQAQVQASSMKTSKE